MRQPEKLNFNVLRYTIGGTTPGDETCGPFRFGAATESFKDGPSETFNCKILKPNFIFNCDDTLYKGKRVILM